MTNKLTWILFRFLRTVPSKMSLFFMTTTSTTPSKTTATASTVFSIITPWKTATSTKSTSPTSKAPSSTAWTAFLVVIIVLLAESTSRFESAALWKSTAATTPKTTCWVLWIATSTTTTTAKAFAATEAILSATRVKISSLITAARTAKATTAEPFPPRSFVTWRTISSGISKFSSTKATATTERALQDAKKKSKFKILFKQPASDRKVKGETKPITYHTSRTATFFPIIRHVVCVISRSLSMKFKSMTRRRIFPALGTTQIEFISLTISTKVAE